LSVHDYLLHVKMGVEEGRPARLTFGDRTRAGDSMEMPRAGRRRVPQRSRHAWAVRDARRHDVAEAGLGGAVLALIEQW
jgi:hypothetical protein